MRSRLPRIAAAAAFLLAIAGCASGVTSPAPTAVFTPASLPPAASTVPGITPSSAVTPSATHSSRTRYPSAWVLPDRKLSPGATQPGYGIRDICPDVNPALEAMRPSTAEKNRVYAAYGITSHPTGKYEIDHVVPVELLGLVDAPAAWPSENLYPELNDTPDPAAMAKYGLSPAFVHNSKDILEDVLHEKVCAGTVPLAAAQHAISTDWRRAYAAYVGKPPGTAPASLIVAPAFSSHAAVRNYPASVPTSRKPPVPAHAACYPETGGGNCYRAGEFCRKSDLGTSGVAGNGERIRCVLSGTRNRWEPA